MFEVLANHPKFLACSEFEAYQALIIKWKALIEVKNGYGRNKKTKPAFHEEHHITPKFIVKDNSKDNIVILDYKSHLEAHRLLTYFLPVHQTIFAYHRMVTANGEKISIDEMERLKIKHSQACRERNNEKVKNGTHPMQNRELCEDYSTRMTKNNPNHKGLYKVPGFITEFTSQNKIVEALNGACTNKAIGLIYRNLDKKPSKRLADKLLFLDRSKTFRDQGFAFIPFITE